jgi:hypothetical protein
MVAHAFCGDLRSTPLDSWEHLCAWRVFRWQGAKDRGAWIRDQERAEWSAILSGLTAVDIKIPHVFSNLDWVKLTRLYRYIAWAWFWTGWSFQGLVGRFATDSPAGGPSTTRREAEFLAGNRCGGAPLRMTLLFYLFRISYLICALYVDTA